MGLTIQIIFIDKPAVGARRDRPVAQDFSDWSNRGRDPEISWAALLLRGAFDCEGNSDVHFADPKWAMLS
jgi:hypothetical protein